VGKTVGQNRMDAGPRRQDLEPGDVSGGWIAAVRRRDGTANLNRGTPDKTQPGH
jgi:hypothetical protein